MPQPNAYKPTTPRSGDGVVTDASPRLITTDEYIRPITNPAEEQLTMREVNAVLSRLVASGYPFGPSTPGVLS